MDDKSLPPNSSAETNVFRIFRGIGDRYSQFEEDSLMSSSPPVHDTFLDPLKFKSSRRQIKSSDPDVRFSHADASVVTCTTGPNASAPKLIIANKSSKISSEIYKQHFTAKFDGASSSPHTGTDAQPSASESGKMLEKAHQINMEKPQSSVLSKMVRRASDTNLFRRMAVGSDSREFNMLVKKANTDIAEVEHEDPPDQKQIPKVKEVKEEIPNDKVGSPPFSKWSAFAGWLYGGKKVVNVDKRDLNTLGPTSF